MGAAKIMCVMAAVSTMVLSQGANGYILQILKTYSNSSPQIAFSKSHLQKQLRH